MNTADRSPAKPRLALYAALAVLAVCCGAATAILIKTGGGRESGGEVRQTAASGQLIMFPDPRPAPDLSFVDASGRRHSLSDWKGRAVLVNLWATWCAPCKTEMPALDRLQARLGSEHFEVIAISTDRGGPEQPAAFFSKVGISHLTLFSDPTTQSLTLLKASGLPLSILVDEHGREAGRLLGPANWDSPESAAKIEELLVRGASR